MPHADAVSRRALQICCVLLATVLGCASAKTSNEKQSNLPPGAPSMIYVQNFELGAATLKADPGTISGRPRLIQFGKKDPATEIDKIGDELEKEIVANLQKAKIPAKRLEDNADRPASGWLVNGELMDVEEGNRMQKAVLGFGIGNSKATLFVNVRDAAKPKEADLLDFNVTSEGNKAPGGGVGEVAMHSPYAMAASFALNRDAVDADIKRAAKEISDRLVKLINAQPAK
jgi:hypothetical protein